MRSAARAGAMLMLATLAAPAYAVCPTILAGSCWSIQPLVVKAAGFATAGDRSIRCSLRCRADGGTLILSDDGTYTTPGAGVTALECPSGATVLVPNEEGTVRRKRGKHVLLPSNLAAFETALASCVGRNLTVRRYRTSLRIAPDGMSLGGVSRLRYVIPGREPVTTTVTSRFTAVRVFTVPASQSTAASSDDALPTCSPDLRPRCVVD